MTPAAACPCNSTASWLQTALGCATALMLGAAAVFGGIHAAAAAAGVPAEACSSSNIR